jgi:acetyl coenzyme A synthetase (ADP forming)-like protein
MRTVQLSAIHDYAAPVVLRDGVSLTLRALRASDRPLLLQFFGRLSPRSTRHHVFGGGECLSANDLAAWATPDFAAKVGLAAVVFSPDDGERIVGVGRYIRVDARGGAVASSLKAHMDFVVEDAYQGRGIGMMLLEHIVEIARTHGVEQIEAEVPADDARMMHVLGASGLVVEPSPDVGTFQVTFPTDSTEAFQRANLERNRRGVAESVRVFFEPASIAVVGASRREGAIGRLLLDNLIRCGFHGPVYAVNAQATEIAGVRCFPSVHAIGAPVDLAIIVVPAPAVEAVILDCARAHVRGVVVISAGFAEVSGDGRQAEARLAALVRSAGMRMVGPNCLGVLSAVPAFSMNATFGSPWPTPGCVSILSQSGGLGDAMVDYAAERSMGIADFVSIGNKADVSEHDVLAYWADDPNTRVIALYLEGLGSPREFARVAREVARKKPIVALKAGRSASGSRAAASHTAALASLDVGIDALFVQTGVLRVRSLQELYDVVTLLSTQPLPEGRGVGVVTNSGGPGILLADACEAHGLTLPELAPETQRRLRDFLPSAASVRNPVDMIASATPDQFARAIETVGADPNVDSVVAIYLPPLLSLLDGFGSAIARAAGAVPTSKPVAAVFMASHGSPSTLASGPRGPIPAYDFPENAACALSAAASCAQWRKRPRGTVFSLGHATVREIRRVIDRVLAGATSPLWASARDIQEILDLVSVGLAPLEQVAPDAERAVAAAARLGYPVVVKAVAAGLLHKTDAGGVALGLNHSAAVREAVDLMASRLRDAGHELEGLVVQRQVEGGVEAIVGVTLDPSLGPLLVAGLGGVQVELQRDVAFRVTPVSDVDAAEMIASLRAFKLLYGFRGSPVADREALLDVIQRLSALAEAVPELVELELNPLKVLPLGQGAVAVDARMRLSPRP